MKCTKCGKSISDDSVFCKYCGKKQIVQKKKRSRSRAGQGSVTLHKASKKYYARITKDKKKVALGYFKTEAEAWQAIDKALLNDNILDNYNWTVEDCHQKWSELHFETLTKNGIQGYKNAWRYFDDIKNLKMRDIKASHLQSCVNKAAELYSRSVCEKVRSLASQLCKFAMKEDLINKNYADFLELPPSSETETTPFTEDEIKILLENDNNDTVKIILILIYTGWRPSELLSLEIKNIDIEKGFFRGGSKTNAGKNRIVPISDRIEPYVNYFYDKAIINNQKYLFVNSVGNKMNLSNFRKRMFYKTLIEIGILKDENDHHLTPYSTRHTFATLCDKAGIDDNILIKMIGHTSKKTTNKFYIHKTEEDMKKAVNSI